ncbi:MAG TPA: alpha-amylase family glycosyl hydrolase [Pyrinomonadaceae bacterium]|jgi:glycosidase
MAKFVLRTTLASLCAVVCLCALAHAQTAAAPVVLKVEPPSWWANHTINPVRLLVRGHNLHGARVTSTRPEIVPSATLTNPAGTYLFVSLTIHPAARPGDYPLTLETTAGKTGIPFRLNAPLDARKNFQGITTDDVLYLIMPDRFSNGDTSNDAPRGSPAAANDRKNSRAFHGGDFRGIINRLPYLKELGVTALWLNPWYDNPNTINECDKPWCPNTNYHGYHAIDYYDVEDHFGDLRTLVELVERAHAVGIKVVQDQVANHVGLQHPWTTDPPLDNWFHGTVARHTQNPFRQDLLLSPHAATEERRPTLDGWFNDQLPDMNQEEPEVSRYLVQNALWWVGITGLDGIRQDTIQFMPRVFIRDLSMALHRQYPRMWMVGEVFDFDPAHTSFFLGGRRGWDGIDTELDAVFDFPLWKTSTDVFTGAKPVRALRDTLKYDSGYTDASRLVTMLGNHDVRRTASMKGMTIEGMMLHTAFLLTMRGTPQLYYGDEIAMEGDEDPDNRRDFPGGWPGDARNAFKESGRNPREQRMFAWTRDWLRLRREHAAIRQGDLVDLFYDADVYVYARRHNDETIVIALNRAQTPKPVSINADWLDAADGARLLPLIITKERIVAASGKFTFNLPAATAVAYKLAANDKTK